MWTKSILNFVVLFACGITLQTCAADPDLNESNGVCKLTCTGAKIASSNMNIRMQIDGSVAVSCHGLVNKSYYGTIPIRFIIEKPATALPAAGVPAGKGTNEEAVPTINTDTLGVPVGGISFEAVVVSGLMGAENPEDDRYKYKGINTPITEWCTDSCGVGAIDITPLCTTSGNAVSILVRSGPISKMVNVTVSP